MKKFNLWPVSVVVFAFLLSLVLVSGCSAVEDVFGGDEDEAILNANKYDIAPFESVEITYENVILSASEYSGRIGGLDVRLFKIDEKLVFIAPVLPEGETFLEFDINDLSYQLAFNMLPASQVSNPDEVVFSFIQEQKTRSASNAALIEELVSENQKQLYTEDLQRINRLFDDAELAFQSATEAEKLEAAQFIAANKAEVEALNLAMDEYVAAVKALGQSKSIYDNESEFNTAYGRFVAARILLISQARKIIAWTAAGAVAGSWFPVIGNGLGAAIGAGIGIGNFLIALEADNIATNQLTEFESIVEELNIDNKATLTFTNKQKKTLSVSGKYNNLNAQYGSSNMTNIKSFVSYLSVFRSLFDQINEYLPETLQIKPKIISDFTSVRNAYKVIHANYLTIGNISNNKVSFSYEVVDGEFKVTFSTDEITDQDFTFDIDYNFNGFSEQTTTQSAKLTVNVDPLLGEWEAYEVDGIPVGQWQYYYLGECSNLIGWASVSIKATLTLDGSNIVFYYDGADKEYQYTGLDLVNCTYESVTINESADDDSYTSTYIVDGNMLMVQTEDGPFPMSYSFIDNNTLVINADGEENKYHRKLN